MIDYAGTARSAHAAIKGAGALVTVSWSVTPDYDPNAPDAPDTAISVTTYGAMVPYPAHKVGTQADALIRAGDRNLLMSALDLAGAAIPEIPPNAVITDAAGGRWHVANAEPIAPAGVAVMYDITARR